MGYEVTIVYPKEEQMDNEEGKFTTINKKESLGEMSIGDVVSLAGQLERSGYTITPTFLPPGEDKAQSPFDIAGELTMSGIDYKATLKCKNSGTYSDAQDLVKLIYGRGFDADIDIKLKVNDDSPVDFDETSTWMDADNTVYKVKPKASSTNANELKGLYDTLDEKGYEVSIDIKPKKAKEDADFETQLSAYPDNTNIKLTLRDSV